MADSNNKMRPGDLVMLKPPHTRTIASIYFYEHTSNDRPTAGRIDFNCPVKDNTLYTILKLEPSRNLHGYGLIVLLLPDGSSRNVEAAYFDKVSI